MEFFGNKLRRGWLWRPLFLYAGFDGESALLTSGQYPSCRPLVVDCTYQPTRNNDVYGAKAPRRDCRAETCGIGGAINLIADARSLRCGIHIGSCYRGGISVAGCVRPDLRLALCGFIWRWPHTSEDLLLGKPDHLRSGVLGYLGPLNGAACQRCGAARYSYDLHDDFPRRILMICKQHK
jgi:hypothetical protein